MHTTDEFASPDARRSTTRIPTGEHATDGEVILTLATRFDKNRKRIESSLYVEHLTDRGFFTRSFTFFEKSVGAGVTVMREPMPRFNQAKARAQHEEALRMLTTRSILSHDDPVQAELARLLHLAMTTA